MKEKVPRNKPVKGVKAFYILKYDPRMPDPRQLISRNYHHISNHPVLANLFPRENLVGGTRRLHNLSEILSPTVQPSFGDSSGGPEVMVVEGVELVMVVAGSMVHNTANSS